MAVTSSYTVQGMTCEHCVRSVSGELLKVAGVHEVVVDLDAGSVNVTSAAPLPLDDVRSAVDEAGYTLAGVAKLDRSSDGEPILPDSTRDDTDAGWGERPRDNADWLREERPPHWD